MKTHVEKTQKNKNQSVANAVSQKQGGGKPTVQFVDNRPEAVKMRQLQEMANSSPRIMQLMSFQEMANRNTAPIQFNGRKRSFSEAFGEHDTSEYEPPKKRRRLLGVRHGTAEERLKRMHSRGVLRRKEKGRIPIGRYNTPTGLTTMSGLFGQRMTQSRQADYGGETFGSVPPYLHIQKNIPNEALSLLSDRNSSLPILTNRQSLATSLAHTLVHGSEEDRAPGTSSYFRAVNRDYVRTQGNGQHPLSIENFPARSTAKEQRDLMEGRTVVSEQQRNALENDSAESSDEDEPHYIQRR